MARIGQRIYGIGSHARSKEGKKKPARQRFFALDFPTDKGPPRFKPVGKPCNDLLTSIITDPKLSSLNLKKAADKRGNDEKGFNIEGLCSTPDGGLLVGLRGPIRKDHAIALHLRNPDEVLAGRKPDWGEPRLIDLGGRGIRSMARLEGHYYIAAQNSDGKRKPAVYCWDGSSADPDRLDIPDLDSLNPESLIPLPAGRDRGRASLLILSDDSSRKLGQSACADVKAAGQRKFRTLWVDRIDIERR
jgi:hypothetical protein